jgi:hypothetical protein
MLQPLVRVDVVNSPEQCCSNAPSSLFVCSYHPFDFDWPVWPQTLHSPYYLRKEVTLFPHCWSVYMYINFIYNIILKVLFRYNTLFTYTNNNNLPPPRCTVHLDIIKFFFYFTNGCTIYLLSSTLKFTWKFTLKFTLKLFVHVST